MHFQTDGDAKTVSELAEFPQGFPDLLQRFLRRHFLGQPVWAHLDARRADVDLMLVKPVDAGVLRRAAKQLLPAAS